MRLAPAASRHGEYGWAGLAVDSATDGGDVVVARGLYRSLSFYREGNLVRNVALRSHPTQVAYAGGKDGKGVPVGVGQPTLKIDNLTVGGTAV